MTHSVTCLIRCVYGVTPDNDLPLESASKMQGYTKFSTRLYARTTDRKVTRDMATLKSD